MQGKEKKNTEISARISLMLEFLAITPNLFAKQLGYERSQTLYDIINGKSAPSYDFFRRFELSEYSDIINASWLIAGKGEMHRGEVAAQTPTPAIKISVDSQEGIPLIPLNAMAGFMTGEVQVLEYECERYVVPLFREADFLIPVKGSSMVPKYNSGDLVACKRLPLNDLFFQWNKVYVLDTAQGPLVKRIKKGTDDEHIQVVSDNKAYDSFLLHKSQIYSVALVVGVIRLE